MSERMLWRLTTSLASLALVAVIVNAILILGNESRQREVNQRQQTISQAIQISRVNQGLVTALAQAAVKNDDKDIREMLASSGYTIQLAPPAEQPAAPATASPSKPAGK